MAKSKYGKYILTDLKIPEETQKTEAKFLKRATRILWLDDDAIKGAPYVTCCWYWKAGEGNPAHAHDFDEIIGFCGGDPQNPHDLGGEIEFWLEDEKHIINKSCLIFVPKGMKHCPTRVLRVDRPIFHFTSSNGSHYIQK